VLTSTPPELAVFAAAEMQTHSKKRVSVLHGGNAEWSKAGQPLEKGETHLASPARDRYKRPYEGTNIGPEVMQAYLDWEFGLVAQLAKDGTHHFWVL
jgi:3-mercaptopyruvate sulfurtransferase SseA